MTRRLFATTWNPPITEASVIVASHFSGTSATRTGRSTEESITSGSLNPMAYAGSISSTSWPNFGSSEYGMVLRRESKIFSPESGALI
ncbi:hypothetical protein D9M68_962480 [compost metagenome]